MCRLSFKRPNAFLPLICFIITRLSFPPAHTTAGSKLSLSRRLPVLVLLLLLLILRWRYSAFPSLTASRDLVDYRGRLRQTAALRYRDHGTHSSVSPQLLELYQNPTWGPTIPSLPYKFFVRRIYWTSISKPPRRQNAIVVGGGNGAVVTGLNRL